MQYHHYIPRFLLRNFSIDNNERIFLLQIYDRKTDQLDVSLVSRTFGYVDMYRNIKYEDEMRVEKELSELERRASNVVKEIIKESQAASQVTLFRKDLYDLRKFLHVMNYRNTSRWSQFTEKRFDAQTLKMVEDFMQEHKLQSAKEVWLQNIYETIKTPYDVVEANPRIFSLDRDEFMFRKNYYVVIWQAGENDEFIVTNNGFGIFEGVNGMIFQSQFQFAFHFFYVISPKLMLVLCNNFFRNETTKNLMYKFFGRDHSVFENAPRPLASSRYIAPGEYRENDTFTFPFVKLPSATVHLVNSFFLNEARPELVLAFLSHSYLYKLICKYPKFDKELGLVTQDFMSLKKQLFKELNRTHKEDLCFRKNISTD
ncbi:5656_t:CDS:2 [Scutellospora calospora]|uniref:5656_t:CDS:1 n=1 Tax=Scutellospora calospora TaxID=85575 RepID=A0ACA9KXP3_9GLOM|nr:5656_t:CDS:2 [Scutellospora calospora]